MHINAKEHAGIGMGYVIFLAVDPEDEDADIEYMSNKITRLRLFADHDNKMNLSVQDIKGDILLISQFTLRAETRKGNRPSFLQAAQPGFASFMYNKVQKRIEDKLGKTIYTGIFGSSMEVQLINDGPVTILLDSKDRFLKRSSS